MDVWDFYLHETLETGCPYDLDIALAEHEEHLNDAELRQRKKSISTVYDDLNISLPDIFNEIVGVRRKRDEGVRPRRRLALGDEQSSSADQWRVVEDLLGEDRETRTGTSAGKRSSSPLLRCSTSAFDLLL